MAARWHVPDRLWQKVSWQSGVGAQDPTTDGMPAVTVPLGAVVRGARVTTQAGFGGMGMEMGFR